MTDRLSLYDTTLRDGQQTQGVQFTATEKAEIAAMLDELGVDYIEGGWPGAVPRDTEFFVRAATELVRARRPDLAIDGELQFDAWASRRRTASAGTRCARTSARAACATRC